MADDVISATGKWVTPEGRVVDKEPVEGRVLVAPGTPITPDIAAAVERAEAAAPPAAVVVDEDDEDDEKAGASGDVETATAPVAKERATATAPVAKERATAPHKRASGR